MKYKLLPAIFILSLMLVSTVSAMPLDWKIEKITVTLQTQVDKQLELCSEGELERFAIEKFPEIIFETASKKSGINEYVYLNSETQQGISMSVVIYFEEIQRALKTKLQTFQELIQLKKESKWLGKHCRNHGHSSGSSSTSNKPTPSPFAVPIIPSPFVVPIPSIVQPITPTYP